MPHTLRLPLCAMLLPVCLGAQQAPAARQQPPRVTLADGLVRQLVEVEGLQPPRITGGLDVGAGQGPLVLLVLRPDGAATSKALPRGYGDLGAAPEPQAAAELEEVEDAPGGKPAPAAPRARRPVAITVRRGDDAIEVGTPRDPARISAAALDAAAIGELLDELATEVDPAHRHRLLLEVSRTARVQDVLTLWQLARDRGFDQVMFGGGASAPLPDATRQQLASLASDHDWPVRRLGPQRVCEGELLVLCDGEVSWPFVSALLHECARAGIWRISFVGQHDGGRCKLPANLPFDEGLLK